MRAHYGHEQLSLPDDMGGSTEPWHVMRRAAFLLVAPFAGLAAAAGVALQLPDVNPLDAVVLPLIALGLLVLAVLVWRRWVRVELAFSVLYGLLASYFVLMLEAQYRLNVGHWQRLSEASYWYATVYALAFLGMSTRRAATVSAVTYALTLLAALIHLPGLAAQGQLTQVLVGILLQFYLASLVMLVLFTGFAVFKERSGQLRLMAYMDFLTGLPNRRYAEEWLAREQGRTEQLTLATFDLDHFKWVNDQCGHAVGDVVLREVARVAGQQMPSRVRLCRWGGEEFLLLLPGLGLSEAASLCERLRGTIEGHPCGEAGTVTASFGVAERLPGEALEATLRRADAALYSAKHSGRNQVRQAPASPVVLGLPDERAG